MATDAFDENKMENRRLAVSDHFGYAVVDLAG
jgi:hypothetical protein